MEDMNTSTELVKNFASGRMLSATKKEVTALAAELAK